MSSEEYAASNAASSSYRPKGYGISPGLQRARRPFRFRNAATGIAIASFVVGVWAYSISAVKQDVFDDVDEEARVLNSATKEQPLHGQTQRLTSAASVVAADVPQAENRIIISPNQEAYLPNRPRGLLFAALCDRYPGLFEPIHKTLVWGAPPVDNVGRLEDKVLAFWKR